MKSCTGAPDERRVASLPLASTRWLAPVSPTRPPSSQTTPSWSRAPLRSGRRRWLLGGASANRPMVSSRSDFPITSRLPARARSGKAGRGLLIPSASIPTGRSHVDPRASRRRVPGGAVTGAGIRLEDASISIEIVVSNAIFVSDQPRHPWGTATIATTSANVERSATVLKMRSAPASPAGCERLGE